MDRKKSTSSVTRMKPTYCDSIKENNDFKFCLSKIEKIVLEQSKQIE